VKLRLLIVSLMVALLSVLANSTVAFAWDDGVGLRIYEKALLVKYPLLFSLFSPPYPPFRVFF